MEDQPPTKIGRPKKDLNLAQLEGLLVRQWTLKEVADFFNCSDEFIRMRVQEHYGMSFLELKREKAASGRALVIEKIVKIALEKEEQWALKLLAVNWLGFKNRPELVVNNFADSVSDPVVTSDDPTVWKEALAQAGWTKQKPVIEVQAEPADEGESSDV